jgi:hypothetical protein
VFRAVESSAHNGITVDSVESIGYGSGDMVSDAIVMLLAGGSARKNLTVLGLPTARVMTSQVQILQVKTTQYHKAS